ncbi:helix-turn-helix domain-containing protein [Geobacillus stearothermophilus]|uniref:helix-turn-helix domain-containing protein n=1 Tax=Geobacillus stearothermophilus TaxID=1422 RepID=UPI003D197A0F
MKRFVSLKKLAENKPKIEDNPHFRTLEEMSEIIGNIFEGGISTITLRQYIREGKIKGFKSGKNWYVENEEIARYILSRINNEPINREEDIWVLWVENGDGDIVDYTFVPHSEALKLGIGDEDEVAESLGYDPGEYLGDYYKIKEKPYIFFELGLLHDENDDSYLRELSPKQKEMIEHFLEPSKSAEEIKNDESLTGLSRLKAMSPKFRNWTILDAKHYYHKVFSVEPREHEIQLFFEYLETLLELKAYQKEEKYLENKIKKLEQEGK